MKHVRQKVILIVIPLIYLFIFLGLRSEYRDNYLAVQQSVYPLAVLAYTVVADILLTITVLLFNSHLWTNIIAGITFAVVIVLYSAFHAKLGLFCSSSELIFSMLTSYIAAYLVKYLLRRSNRKLLTTIVGTYFSKNTKRKILSNLAACEPTKRQITMLECSISDMELLAKEATPKELFSKINHILDIVINSVISNSGRVDKFVGTKIYAYWENPQDAYLAVKSAMEAFQILERTGYEKRLNINIAIHFEEAIIGILGTSRVMNYSVVSSSLELLDEIVKSARMYNKKILVSKSAYKQCWRDISAVKAATLNLRGEMISTELFEPLELKARSRLTHIFEINKDDKY